MTKLQLKAQVEATLVDFEGPQVVLAYQQKRPLFGVAVPKQHGMQNPFFFCAAKDKSFEKYFSGRADLRYVFETAYRNAYFVADVGEINRPFSLKKASRSQVEDPDLWPFRGIFIRDHTTDFGLDTSVTGVQTYYIDGSWRTSDFAKFNNRLADIYAICDLVRGANTLMRDAIKESIEDAKLNSGGGYRGFYSVLKRLANSLSVNEIQYASPGHISVNGNAEALEEVEDIISRMISSSRTLNASYKDLSKILRDEGLLSTDSWERFSSAEIAKRAKGLASQLYTGLGFDNGDWLFEQCQDNEVVYAKVVRSVYIRSNNLWKYFQEGRLVSVE